MVKSREHVQVFPIKTNDEYFGLIQNSINFILMGMFNLLLFSAVCSPTSDI